MYQGGMGQFAARQRERLMVTGGCNSVHSHCFVQCKPILEEFFSESQAALNTSFLKTDSVSRDKLSHRIFSEGIWKALSAFWALKHQELETQAGFPGLSEKPSWSGVVHRSAQRACIYWVNRPCCRENIRLSFSSWLLPMCHFVKAACCVETNTFWLFLALCSQRKSHVESHSILWIILQSAS